MEEVVIFDLEFTAWEGSQERKWSGPNEHREVVQIGAVKVDVGTLKEIESLSLLVKPAINPMLSEYFINLTGITLTQIDSEGVSYQEALKKFEGFVGKRLMYSWGSDPKVLKENCDLYNLSFPFSEEQFVDMRTAFTTQGIDAHRYSSSTIPEAFGVSNPSPAHDALNDARSILLALTKLPENPFMLG